MDYDEHKVDEAALALLWLTAWREASYPAGALGPGEPAAELWRAWKGVDWDVLDRLHAAGAIGDPKTRAKSVWLTTDGRARAEAAFEKLFGVECGLEADGSEADGLEADGLEADGSEADGSGPGGPGATEAGRVQDDGQPLDGQPLDGQPLDGQPLDGQPLDGDAGG